MQISEAELTIEALRKSKQALEDSIIGERQPTADSSIYQRPQTTTSSDGRTSRPASASNAARNSSVKVTDTSTQDVGLLFEECVEQLLQYHEARRQVLSIIKEKKEAELNKSEAARRVSALEMQKMRQSLSVRESISDLSNSLRVLDNKMQKENRTLDEIERLTKLKQRAERKLSSLRQQEEHEEFLDGDKQQELADLEELIVDLDSHIAFQDAELAAARKELSAIKKRTQIQDESPLDALAASIVHQLGAVNEQAARVVVSKCLEEIVRLRMRQEALHHEVKELSAVVEERDAVVNQLESGLSVARSEFERRLELQHHESGQTIDALQQQLTEVLARQQQQEQQQVGSTPMEGVSESEWQKLVASGHKKDEYIGDLEKHLVFYKSKSKQMQAQLQQLIRDSNREVQDGDGGSTETLHLRQRVQQLEDANDALTKDLAAAKVRSPCRCCSVGVMLTSSCWLRSTCGRRSAVGLSPRVPRSCASPRASCASSLGPHHRHHHHRHTSQTTNCASQFVTVNGYIAFSIRCPKFHNVQFETSFWREHIDKWTHTYPIIA
jgi:predicted house-cleaning noncanonical NTP pyrophosphatase (MazG superfamily)